MLKIGKMSRKASEAAIGSGFGSTLAGIGTGVAVGSLTNSSNAMIAGGLAGGLASMAADSLIKDVNYAMITDIQISETRHHIQRRAYGPFRVVVMLDRCTE